MLRKEGMSKGDATAHIEHQSIAEKNELLFSRGIHFNNLPNWQKRGIGFYFIDEEKKGFNPKENTETITTRKTIKIDMELPMRDEYSLFIAQLLEKYE